MFPYLIYVYVLIPDEITRFLFNFLANKYVIVIHTLSRLPYFITQKIRLILNRIFAYSHWNHNFESAYQMILSFLTTKPNSLSYFYFIILFHSIVLTQFLQFHAILLSNIIQAFTIFYSMKIVSTSCF